MNDFFHNHKDFPDLIRIVGEKQSIDPALIEKDYWIMHCLYGLKQLKMSFQLKGGTSLSKGYGIIERFSEDIDIRIEPPDIRKVATNPNQQSPKHIETRKNFYDWLAKTIKINGIIKVERNTEFDDPRYYRSGGITLQYKSQVGSLAGIKNGILLEVGFDDVSPNTEKTISSWVYDYAADRGDGCDNRANNVACYHPEYTFVEKLQTISTKYRKQQEDGDFPKNFMRHYYDVYQLLKEPTVRTFIGTEEYTTHKEKRFRDADNPILAENEAFLLSDPVVFKLYKRAYNQSSELYYKSQPDFSDIMKALAEAIKIEGI